MRQRGSILGILQYFSSAFSLYGNDNTDSSNESVKYTYDSYDTRLIPYTNLPFVVVPTLKDTVLSKDKVNDVDWSRLSTRDSLNKSNEAKRLNAKYNLK